MLENIKSDIDQLSEAIGRVVESAVTEGTQTVEIETTQFKTFRNIVHFVTDPEGLAISTLWENPRQYQMLCEFYSLFCPKCNKPNDNPDPSMRWDRWNYTPTQLQQDVLFARNENREYVCPSCGLKQKDSGEPNYNTVILKVGMRCVGGDTIVYTKDGLQSIERRPTQVQTREGTQPVTGFYPQGEKPAFRVTVRGGYDIIGSSDHPLLIERNGETVFVPIGKLQPTDSCLLPIGFRKFGTIRLPYGEAKALGLTLSDLSHIPDMVLRGSASTVQCFLQGLFESRAKFTNNALHLNCDTELCARQIQLLLQNFGIFSYRDNTCLRIFEYVWLQKFKEIIGFSPRKMKRLDRILRIRPSRRIRYPILRKWGGEYITAKIRSIASVGVQSLYDLEVPQNQAYFSNGFVSHNSGKTIFGAMVALWELHSDLVLDNPQKTYGLVPNQLITYSLATTQGEQGVQTIYGAVDGFHKNSPWFTHYNAALKKAAEERKLPLDKVYVKNLDEIRYLNKSLIVSVSGSNSAALAGRTRKLVVIDEIARFVNTDSRMGVDLVYDTLEASLLTLANHGSRMVCISSPMWDEDKMCRLYRDALERKSPNVLCRTYETWNFNPQLPREHPFIVERYDRDPVAANRDYGCVAPGVESAWIPDGWRIDQCIDKSLVRLITDQNEYSSMVIKNTRTDMVSKNIIHKDLSSTRSIVIACDPGWRSDSFAMILAYVARVRTIHGFEDHVMIGGNVVWEPQKKPKREVDFLNVLRVILECCKFWDVEKVVFDQWQSVSAIQQIRSKGVIAEQIPLKKEDWELLATMIYQKQIHFLDPEKHGHSSKRLLWELKNLVMKENGKVDHSPSSSSDIAVCVARAVKALAGSDANTRRMWEYAGNGGRAVRFARP